MGCPAVNSKIHLEDPVKAIIAGGYEGEAILMLMASFQERYQALSKKRAECAAALNDLRAQLKGAT